MLEEHIFVGRKNELNEFNNFVNGNRPNLRGHDTGPPLLLVVGEPGIGKWSLLKEMAKQATAKKNYVFCRRLYCTDMLEQYVYQLIAMLKAVKPDRMGALSDWVKLGFIAGKAILPPLGAIEEISDLYLKIQKEHETSKCSVELLANRFCQSCSELKQKLSKDQKIVILLYPKLDPRKETPDWVITFLELLYYNELPSRVRIVLAQSPTDAVITGVEEWVSDELNKLCAKPIYINQMSRKDSLSLLKTLDIENKLDSDSQKIFLDRYGGWPHLMQLAWEELQKIDRITLDSISSLPNRIEKYWARRYKNVKDENQRAFLHTANLLPHPYPISDVAEFAKLAPEKIELACGLDCPVWQLLSKEDYPDESLKTTWKDCPTPKHPTEKEFIVNQLTSMFLPLYKKRMSLIAQYYKKKLIRTSATPKLSFDASRYLLDCLIEAEFWDEVRELMTNIDYLKSRREASEEYIFQRDFKKILKSCPYDILPAVLKAIQQDLKSPEEKANWLDTFSYWINEFGVKVETDNTRASELKKAANEFDRACGVLSKELADMYFNKGGARNYTWALRFAELFTWVYQRAGDYEMCSEACGYATKLCAQTTDNAYRYLARAEFLRMRAQALKKIWKEKQGEDERAKVVVQIKKAYSELIKIFPREKMEITWPSMREWKQTDKIMQEGKDLVLKAPSINSSPAFRARVISNLDDCISAMEVINFLNKNGGHVEWIHHKMFEYEHFAEKDLLFTVLIGGPKAPGISKVAHRFYEYSEKNRKEFLEMYSGQYCKAKRLKTMANSTHCYMLGGISKINTLKAAYDFTKDTEVNKIVAQA